MLLNISSMYFGCLFWSMLLWGLPSSDGYFLDCNSSFNSHMAANWCLKLAVAQRRCPFSLRSSVKVTWGKKKSANFDPNCVFTGCNSSLKSWIAMKWCAKLINQISSSYRAKICWFWPKLSAPGLLLEFEFTNLWNEAQRLEVAQKRCPACFKVIFSIVCFQDGYEIMQEAWKLQRRGALLFLKVIHIASMLHGTKMANCEWNWALLDCNNYSLNWLMALKWCTKFNIKSLRFPMLIWLNAFKLNKLKCSDKSLSFQSSTASKIATCTILVNAGWMHFKMSLNKYVIQRSSQAGKMGGTHGIHLPSSYMYDDIIQRLENVFFPNGKNSVGKLLEMDRRLRFSDGTAMNRKWSLMDAERGWKTKSFRLYLLTKQVRTPVTPWARPPNFGYRYHRGWIILIVSFG